MQNLPTIISISCTALGLLITAITFIVRFIKSLKEKRLAQDTLKICEALKDFVASAEKFLNYSAHEKKEFALTKANQFAIDNKIAFNAAFIGDKIEELVRLSKEVNVRDKDRFTFNRQHNFNHNNFNNSNNLNTIN